MSVYAISYDLNTPGQQYSDLHDAIKSLGTWWHFLDSTWLLSTSLRAEGVANRLRQVIDQNDHLLVIKVTAESAGWLPQKAWDWISQHVKETAY